MHRTARVAAVGTAVGAVGLAALLIHASTASAEPDGSGRGPTTTTLNFDVQFSPFSYTDLGKPGPSAADVIVFHDRLFQDGRQVAEDVGSCVVVEPDGLSNCTGVVAFLDRRGSIAFAFENSPPPHKTVAITGGTGNYRTARGDGEIVESATGPTGTMTLHVIH